MAISVDGIVSGIDTTSLISELSASYSAPKTLLEEDIVEAEALQSGMTALSGLLSDLSESLENIQDVEDLRAYTVSYPETDALIAEADGEAIAGVYSVEITALASSELEVSEGFADQSSTGVIATGTLSVTYAGTTTDITVDATNSSLVELASDIDGIDGISAYVMDTGDASTPYRLVIQGEDTGDSNTITMDTSGLTGAGTVPTFTEQTTAANAELSINGIDVTSESNTVNDSIAGLSLDLTAVTTDPIDVTISLDADGMEEKVESFVTAYNAVIDYIDTNSAGADSTEGTAAGVFNGNSSIRWISQTLTQSLSTSYTDNDLNSLGLMGIGTDGTGRLELDSDDFQDALSDYRGDVEKMFTADDGFGAALVASLDVFIDPIDGVIKERNSSLESSIDDLEDQVATWETRIERYEDRLRSSFTTFESTVGVLQGVSDFLTAFFFTEDS
ncbi:MAG: flagellar filament capping protein FliD [Myxococcota bacterium]|nr:flagellar filament capping protein FliD [Myxococcota bacterium]